MGMAVPGIELIDVLDLTISLQLHMAGNRDGVETGAVKVLLPEVRRPEGGGAAPSELPKPVQTLAQGIAAAAQRCFIRIADVIGVGIQTVNLKYGGIFQPL